MTTEDAIKHFGSGAVVGRALDISRQAVCNWGEYPPRACQLDLQTLTDGELKAEPRAQKRNLGAA